MKRNINLKINKCPNITDYDKNTNIIINKEFQYLSILPYEIKYNNEYFISVNQNDCQNIRFNIKITKISLFNF
jgi:hypothetical protein